MEEKEGKSFAVVLAIRDADISPVLYKQHAADETKYLQRHSTAVLLRDASSASSAR